MELVPFAPEHAEHAADLIGRAMNASEGAYARRSFAEYFATRRMGITDGRELFVLLDGARLIGITGLHHYNWGPPENVWLSWFAVEPTLHGRGLGTAMLEATIRLAAARGFQKLFVETYSSPEFSRARRFYLARGFKEVGAIENYMSDGAEMIVYCRQIGCPTARLQSIH